MKVGRKETVFSLLTHVIVIVVSGVRCGNHVHRQKAEDDYWLQCCRRQKDIEVRAAQFDQNAIQGAGRGTMSREPKGKSI